MSLFNSSMIGLLFSLFTGTGVGVLLAWYVLPSGRNNQRMQEQLKAAEEKLERYQEDVREHFSKTSNLVNDLTSTYHQLHEHLSMGAYILGNHSLSNDSLRLRDLHFPEFGLTDDSEEPAARLNYSSISLDKKDVLSIEESYA
jgi:uncharacterized membrane-anchored protein YhcB (DUF1043 family)